MRCAVQPAYAYNLGRSLAMNLTAGSRLGPYEVTALIGHGGMGGNVI